MPIQWLITLFALFAVGRAVAAWRADMLDRRKLFFWIAFWVVVTVVIWLPQATSMLAAALGVGRGVDVVIYLSVVLLFYMSFQISRKVDRLERSLTDLVRTIALSNITHDKSEE